jgi:hypothetical protein
MLTSLFDADHFTFLIKRNNNWEVFIDVTLIVGILCENRLNSRIKQRK